MVRYAGFWRRALAALVDGALIAGVFVLILSSRVANGAEAGTAIVVLLVIVAPLVYHVAFDASSYSGSPGKRLMGLRVLDLAGQRLDLGSALLRNGAKIVSVLLAYVGFAAAGFTSRKQGLHDLLARAVVVREPLPAAPAFQSQVLADYRSRQDVVRILVGLGLVAVVAALSVLVQSSAIFTGAVPSSNDMRAADIARLHAAQTFRCEISSFDNDIVVDSVNWPADDSFFGSARLVGNAGSSDLLAVSGRQMVSFLEVTPSGATNLITIYGFVDSDDRYQVVFSRHTAIAGPTPSQYHGACTALF